MQACAVLLDYATLHVEAPLWFGLVFFEFRTGHFVGETALIGYFKMWV